MFIFIIFKSCNIKLRKNTKIIQNALRRIFILFFYDFTSHKIFKLCAGKRHETLQM